MTELTYCLAGETPGFENVEVTDLATGQTLDGVIEVNTIEGWLVRQKREPDGSLLADPVTGRWPKTERIEGRFGLSLRKGRSA